MMNFTQLRYMLDETAIMLGRRKAAGAIAVVIMGLSLLILVVFLMVTLNIAEQIGRMSEEMRLFVYLKDGTGQALAGSIQYRLLSLPGVEEVSFISRDEALAELEQMLEGQQDLLEDLPENPLPDAFRIKPKPESIGAAFFERTAAQIGEWDGVEDVRYGRKWFERGERLVKGFFVVDLALGLIIFLSVIFVIYNTVRLTVMQRRRAIDVMKLVGADNTFIQLPFILEGALHGIAASILAIALLTAIYLFSSRYLPGLTFMRYDALAGFVVFCALLGAVGSYSAMRRLLRS
jgi:cell division transport system permease protein